VPDELSFTARVFTTPGDGAWHMVTLPEGLSDEIEARYAGPRRGFGAVRVKARIGTTTWGTSIFPSKARGAYVMGIKRAVREAEHIDDGAHVAVSLEIPDLK
jgi:hypothetical protein